MSEQNSDLASTGVEPAGRIRVFTAQTVVTMDPTLPTATAVAVRDGLILGVGSVEDLQPWLAGRDHVVDDRYADSVLMPGLIDAHLHPLLGALQFGTVWITPEAWDVLGVHTPATTSADGYLEALRAAVDADPGTDPMFITWGYSPLSHGEMSRTVLDGVSTTQPIFVWHRSGHDAYFNTAMLDYLQTRGVTAEAVAGNPQIDWEHGHFFEDGFFKHAVPALASYLLAPDRVDRGFLRVRDYLLSNGVTTVADMATGITSWDLEVGALTRTFNVPESPVRVRLTPDVGALSAAMGGQDAAFAFVEGLDLGLDHLPTGRAVKLFADGAFFSQAMQISAPGYIDGHHGEWITQPAAFEALARRYWQAGYQIHVHTNGDAGATMVLDVLEKLSLEHPRPDHRWTIEHYGYATDAISRRVAALGAQVSANPYYLYLLGDTYAVSGLGPDRASRIAPLGGLVRRGVSVALHSDFAMAPSAPLTLAWAAAARETQSGRVFSPGERLTLDQALRAVTIDAAHILGLGRSLGSVEAGKSADFTVLDANPYDVGVAGLRDITVQGTVFQGRPFAAPTNA